MYSSAIITVTHLCTYDLDLWPLISKTFPAIPTHMMNIHSKFHWNLRTKWKDTAACKLGDNRQMDNGQTNGLMEGQPDWTKLSNVTSSARLMRWLRADAENLTSSRRLHISSIPRRPASTMCRAMQPIDHTSARSSDVSEWASSGAE